MNKRVRCSDDVFLEAVYSSKTYAEIAAKTGQKISTTMSRYIRMKNMLSKQGIDIPKMERKKQSRINNLEKIVAIAHRLQSYNTNL